MISEQPHFDDESTVLSAQPVVPLEQLEAKVKHRRRWFLGSAFAVAMLLGAASALVSAYFKLRNAPEPEIQTQSAVLSVPEPTPETVVIPTPEEEPTVTPKRPVVSERERDFADRGPRVVEPPLRDEEDELRRIRDAVLVDEWQERREWEERRQRRAERRAERRERRRAERDSDRDLSNLDEIFEGRRRPKG
jgi:hypothetical protein